MLFFLFTGIFSSNANAQNITLKTNQTTLRSVLNKIEQQSGYDFWYNKGTIDEFEKISTDFKDQSLNEVLKYILLPRKIGFEIVDKTIFLKPTIIKEQGKTNKSTMIIEGVVVDHEGKPVPNATIKIKNTNVVTAADASGRFRITSLDNDGILIVSSLGFEQAEASFSANKKSFQIALQIGENKLEEVDVVSTGYQKLDRKKLSGSFIQLDEKLLNRSVSTNLLDRLKDIAPGVYFQNRDPQLAPIARSPNQRSTGIIIRGESTFSGSKEPLIILDNFPYEGEIKNINPNDIESVTVLKDASAASIWGARSGNGVIVITTKTGKFNQKQKIAFNSNVTVIEKPNIFYSRDFLNAESYIEVEKYLYDRFFFNTQLNNTTSFPVVSPAIELMKKLDLATTDSERNQLQNQLNTLKTIDVRDDYRLNVYQKAINQQYALSLSGGTQTIGYNISVGQDINQDNLLRNGYRRTTMNFQNIYRPIEKLEITAGINYSQSKTNLNNAFAYGAYAGVGSPYIKLYPYARLADDLGNSLPILQGLRMSYLDQARSKGFLDWYYRPLDEIILSDNSTRLKDLLLRFTGKYKITNDIEAVVNYQNEYQNAISGNHRSLDTYYTRNLVNQYSAYNSTTGTFTYNIPKNGILDVQNSEIVQNNIRGQLNYFHSFQKHNLSAILGAEIGETTGKNMTRTSYGYNDQLGTSSNNLNYSTIYSLNPSGSGLISAPDGNILETLNRRTSYYAVAAYSFLERYYLNLSAREDGANLFGAKVNDKIQPFFSAGIGWELNKEAFYKIRWLPSLKLRASYGYQGNSNQSSSAYLQGVSAIDLNTGAPTLSISTAPNPRLQWENIQNTNIGVDFSSKKNRISGTIDLYRKRGKDLIQPTILAPQTGFATYQANTASTETLGVDFMVQSKNLNGNFGWTTSFLLSGIKDKVVKYDVPRAASSISIPAANFAEGKPLNALFSYKWGGLNPQNGNPRGYLNGQVSENYLAIINNYTTDSLVYNGSLTPTLYGAFRNEFFYRGFILSINISYRLGYVFRRSSTSLNYTNVIQNSQHNDYTERWQKVGDENTTNIPSLVYPANNNRNAFYQSSEILVEKGDHIRLQDIRLSYTFTSNALRKIKISDLAIYGFANNLGILWRENRLGLDPSAVGNTSILYPLPFSISFGLTANF